MDDLRFPNVPRDPDRERDYGGGMQSAASGYAGPPRRVRDNEPTGTNAVSYLSGAIVLKQMPFVIFAAFMAELLIFSWFPHPSPGLLVAMTCTLLSRSIRGHNPDDKRYGGLRLILRTTAAFLLAFRLASQLANGWEGNLWFIINWLPDTVRMWGDVESVFQWLLCDPLGMLTASWWVSDGWYPLKLQAALSTGPAFWRTYRAPTEVAPPWIGWLPILPIIFARLPQTTNDWLSSLAFGLGVNFIVGYVVTVEVSDIFCFARQSLRRRAAHISKFSDRRYIVLFALTGGLVRLSLLLAVGIAAISYAGKDQNASLLPAVLLLLAAFVIYPRYYRMSWMALEAFDAYPGDKPAEAGTHELSLVMRNRETRQNLIVFAGAAWVPFVYGCVQHFLPGFPSYDGFGIRWPDLYLRSAAFAILIVCFAPPQLLCAVIRAAYGPILGRYFRKDAQ